MTPHNANPTMPSQTPRPAGPLGLVVNGEAMTLAAESLAEVVEVLGYGGQKVATALNGDFVPAHRRGETPVGDGDRIEIVAPRQGG